MRQFKLSTLTVVAILAIATVAQAQSTKPVVGLRDKTPSVHALVNARVYVNPNKVLSRATIVIRDGLIADVTSNKPPADARVWDLQGRTVYAGFIDAYSESAVATSAEAPRHWNPNVRPESSAAESYKADAPTNKKLRSQGITARLVASNKGIIRGRSALFLVGDGDNSKDLVRANVAQHLRLTINRTRNRENYPNSPMGAVALARQTFYDARWYTQAWVAYVGGAGKRPEKNISLQALGKDLRKKRLMIVRTRNELYALRAERFAREFSIPIALVGSGREYRRLREIAAMKRTIILPVNFPQPPNVATIESSLNVTLAQLMHWDIAPENPARLAAAGVHIAFTTSGLSDPGKFLWQVRKAVKRGLPQTAALQALTTAPAKLFGVSKELGTVEKGKIANLVVASGNIFQNGKIESTWVAGKRHSFVTKKTVDLRGTWLVSAGEKIRFKIKLTGSASKLTGTAEPERPKKVPPKTKVVPTKLNRIGQKDLRFGCTFNGRGIGLPGTVRLTAVAIQGKSGPTLQGQLDIGARRQADLTARRIASPKAAAKKKAKSARSIRSSFPVNYPLGAFGRTAAPTQPAVVLFRNATVWTCGKAGVLTNASVLVRQGKIAAIGKSITAPTGALVVDCKGQHLSPGIIDCHSHMATDGGVNESTQAVTAEVRIGDFIDCNDINIYRQLAGGVTCSNILHGSANPIGGQNQVIKLKWGAISEQMKFKLALQGVKFALGENVKQANWGDEYTTRYPQTRMGVEQIFRDSFQNAIEYRKRWDQWNKTKKGVPPRRNLETDAIAEILAGKRWIHCHSYRQDEILALIRVLDQHKITIGTFQHILEGYKVAKAMAKHGAMGSAFSDWWAYKFEVYDAIPYNGALMHRAGVVVSFNSDDRELARHLNHEAAKAIKYGGVKPAEALKFVTLNPAKQLRIDKHVGSIEIGKQADLVVWSSSPLSTMSRCEQTWIEGRKYFDRRTDLNNRRRVTQMRVALINKILDSGQKMLKPGEHLPKADTLWPREDIFCHHHGHGHNH